MKYFTCVFLCFSMCVFAQKNYVTLYGQLTTAEKPVKVDLDSKIGYAYKGKPRKEQAAFYVSENGFFALKLPRNKQVTLSPFIKNYYHTDTIIHTGKTDSLKVVLWLKPKIYTYSETTALQDIAAGKIQIVTSDTLLYNQNQKTHYTRPFGFTYVLKNYTDPDYTEHQTGYNITMWKHLATVISASPYPNLAAIEDSITYLTTDRLAQNAAAKLTTLKVPPYRRLPPEMKKAITSQNMALHETAFGFNDYPVKKMLYDIDHSTEYSRCIEAMDFFIAKHYREMIPELIARITNKTEIGLINTNDLIIWERAEIGDLKVADHGTFAANDLFTVAGRANHLLCLITGNNFGTVSMYSTGAYLQKLQNRWAYWLAQLQYTKQKG